MQEAFDQKESLFGNTKSFLSSKKDKKISKPKDYRQSKGRKIKYVVYDKLVNFLPGLGLTQVIPNRD